MSLRFGSLYTGGRYHVFNRTVEGIEIFKDWRDLEHFYNLLELVATEEQIHSIRDSKRGDFEHLREKINQAEKLVRIEAFAVLPNHFHLLITQETEDGLARFMQKLCAGYSNYFNTRYSRSGTLWMGKYKYIEIENEYSYLRVGSYVSRNHEIHQFKDAARPRRTGSSYAAMIANTKYPFCDHQPLLDTFGGIKRYKEISQAVVDEVRHIRGKEKTNEDIFLEK